jgi:hypothetical protein
MTENSKIPAAQQGEGARNPRTGSWEKVDRPPEDFTAALREQRDRFRNADGGSPHATISDLLSSGVISSGRTKPPEVRRSSATLTQNSDALDDALTSVKGVAKSGFTSCVDSFQGRVMDLPNPPDRTSLFLIRDEFKNDVNVQIDKAYDAAESSGQSLPPAAQEQIIQLMNNVEQVANGIVHEVADFVEGCPLEDFRQGLEQVYNKIINFINNALQ